MAITYDKIPNNIDLASNRKVKKALEAWQPDFKDWWMEMGPEGFQQDDIYLRTAISVDSSGWAHFDYVKMPDYRWGIFLTPPEKDRKIGFGDNAEMDAWEQVPGEYRKELRRIIVTQCDTEPASVEQQRLLGKTAPSLYDMRNLFQVNVEEGRHLWAMVHLLHEYFGRDGRDEADEMLQRRSGNADSPRILEAFNKPCEDWLAFFCFAMFMDRDGKYQLGALAESGFDPLARATKFMLTEEAHHLFVGETGVGRVVARTAQVMAENPETDPHQLGIVSLDIIQKYINEWYTGSLDLFGGEDSSNAANYFGAGLKGRFQEMNPKRFTEHQALEGCYELDWMENGQMASHEIPMRRAMNLVLRDAYKEDCERAMVRWNKSLEKAGLDTRLYLPSQRFNRKIGVYANQTFSPQGELLSDKEYTEKYGQWIPTREDLDYVKSLMVQVTKPGEFAGWINPPGKGLNGQPIDFEYVKFVNA
jgi:benzoyl-CoA 2,3-dioxygenase component B